MWRNEMKENVFDWQSLGSDLRELNILEFDMSPSHMDKCPFENSLECEQFDFWILSIILNVNNVSLRSLQSLM